MVSTRTLICILFCVCVHCECAVVFFGGGEDIYKKITSNHRAVKISRWHLYPIIIGLPYFLGSLMNLFSPFLKFECSNQSSQYYFLHGLKYFRIWWYFDLYSTSSSCHSIRKYHQMPIDCSVLRARQWSCWQMARNVYAHTTWGTHHAPDMGLGSRLCS